MNKTHTKLSYLAILSLFMLTGIGTYENASMQTTIDAYSSIAPSTIRLMVTLPSLVATVTMLIAGKLVGTKLKYKQVVFVGAVSLLIGGCVPFFYAPSWFFILVCRTLLGFGAGCLSVRNALLSQSVDSTQLAKYLGIGTVMGSLINMIASPIVGSLVKNGYQYGFLMNFIVVIPLLMIVFFIKEPGHHLEHKSVKANKLPRKIWLFVIIQFVATLVLYPLLSGMSSYMSEIGYSDPTIAGYMLSIYTGTGIVTNLFLKQLLGICKRHALTIAFTSTFIGGVLLLLRTNLVVITIGVFLSGLGFTFLSAYMQVITGLICDETNVANGSTMILAAIQAGVFLSSYFIEITSYLHIFNFELLNTFFICTVTYFVLLLINLVFNKQLNS